jgi:hypothetical protein
VLVASGARLVLDSAMVAAADQNDGIYNAGILT